LGQKKIIKLVLFRLKRSAHGIGAGGRKGRAYANLLGGAIAVALMILAILYIAADAAIDMLTAAIISFHHLSSPFR
jgi:hypothetical protein